MIKTISILMLLVFVLMEYKFKNQIEALGLYFAYITELIFVILSLALIWRNSQGEFKFLFQSRSLKLLRCLQGYGLAFVLGFSIHALTVPLSLPVPFDFTHRETLLFLHFIGPLLEEFLFRGALWGLFQNLKTPPPAILLITTAAFSFAHFFAYFSVPPEFHSFVYYQTAYTLVLGLLCGLLRRSAGIIPALIAHFLFNLGFYIFTLL